MSAGRQQVKPWPGLVDVELMPETDEPEAAQEDANEGATEGAET